MLRSTHGLLWLLIIGTQEATSISQRSVLHSTTDKFLGVVASVCSNIPARLPSLFSHVPETILFQLSYLKAKNIFWYAYNRVPAYRQFVDYQCDNTLPESFEQIPITSKLNYIKKYPLTHTLVDGVFPLKGQIDTSTGTSGVPTKWVRGHQEMRNVKKWIRIASKTAIGNQSYIFCNMFALGPWATGMTSTYALSENQVVLSIGPDIEKLYDVLKDFGPSHRYVIAGYPPHMKKLVEHAPYNLHEYNITMVVGGEAMSESVYRSLKRAGIRKIFSSYGASDLRINIAQQTEFEQKLQRICAKNSAFKQELLGTTSGIPTFFHYNPLLDYIEQTADGRLLFTDLDSSRVSPRVRYDVGDQGQVLPVSRVTHVLEKYGYQMRPHTTLPILCLYGRGEDTLTFNGCNIMYDDLEKALEKISLLKDVVNRYAYNKFENQNLDQQLEFWIELKDNVALQDLPIDTNQVNEQIIAALTQVNQDFKSQIEYIKNNQKANLPFPCTYIYEYGKSPMVQQDAQHKNKYVYGIMRPIS